MKKEKPNYNLIITKNDKVVYETWLTDEQKSIIQHYTAGATATFRHNPQVDEIIETVCEYYKVSVDWLAKSIRWPEAIRCRYLCFYFFINKLHYTHVRAGKIFNRDHATVICALKKVSEKYKSDVIEIERILSKK